jgi:YHS domain-containing protein
MRLVIACAAIVALALTGAAQTPKAVTVLKGFDPIELIDGREVKGSEDLSVVRGKYRYLFATDANRRRFEKSPAEYQIQMGGGCGRMGSLSGVGNPDRFHVFNRRIYIFASEQCRNSFKSAPENHLEAPDAPPAGSAAEQRRAGELIDLALAGLGGAKRVDAIKTLQARITLAYKQGDKVSEYFQTQTFAFPGRYRNEYDWGSSKNTDLLLPGAAISVDSGGAWVREEPVRAALAREYYRHPLAILKSRRDPGFVAFAAGKDKIGEVEVELLKVGVSGATTTLFIDARSGRILQTAYRDRKGAFGEVVKTYSDFREAGGLTLPFKVEESFNGKPVASPEVGYESVTINGKLDPKLFQKPSAPAGSQPKGSDD